MVAITTLTSALIIAFAATNVNAAPSLAARDDGVVRANTQLTNDNCQFSINSRPRTFFNRPTSPASSERTINRCYNENYQSVAVWSINHNAPVPNNCAFKAYQNANCGGTLLGSFTDSQPQCHFTPNARSFNITCT